MKKTKRFVAILLACLFCVSAFVGCSGDTGTDVDDTTAADTTAVVEDEKWPEVEGTVIYVDVTAEEGGDGTKDNPFKNITEAQAKIREMKAGEGLPKGGITVLLASGEYSVADTVTFTAEDSGTADSPITYMSAKEHRAVFTGGITLNASDFEPITDEEKAKLVDGSAKEAVLKLDLTKYGITTENLGILSAYGTDLKGGSADAGKAELFVNGERMELSRYPNITADDSFIRVGDNDNVTVFTVQDEYKETLKERAKLWQTEDVYISAYLGYAWAHGAYPVETLDVDTLTVTMAQQNYYGLEDGGRLYFFNVFAETDDPGEYYIDRDNCVLYHYPTEDFETASLVISVFDKPFIVGTDLSYVTFSGIYFTATKSDGLVLSGDNIIVDNCKISDIYKNGIVVNGYDITIKNSDIYCLGRSATIVSGGDLDTLTPSNNLIYNNRIYSWGQLNRTHQNAVTIQGCGVTVSHNEIYDAPHQAITWSAPNNIIEYNEVYNVCFETSDCGALYAGRRLDWYGTIIRYNYIHDIGGWETAAAHAIYWDDGLSGQTAYGNVIANTTSYGIHVGGGRDNVIENNLIINPGNAFIYYDDRARGGIYSGNIWEHTVEMAEVLAEKQLLPAWVEKIPGYGDIIPYEQGYSGDVNDLNLSCNPANNIIRNNMLYEMSEGSHEALKFAYQVFNMSTVENNLLFTDLERKQVPNFDNGDCTLADDAEAYKNGFEKIPFDEIGRIKEDK
ncbi:MAG: right-handed parallel beta-helix repeat-containing protein [Clostridia bacterium]|nr:right-handed parallel beta-helix repeat-containing protein [Clostridia bacterium]